LPGDGAGTVEEALPVPRAQQVLIEVFACGACRNNLR
jgi:hypothetical protein